MQKEARKHQIISHYQIVVDEFQNVTLIGYDLLKDEYDVAVLQYSRTEQQALKPLKQLTQKRGPFKQFSEVKKITSSYSKIINAKALLGTIRFLQGYYLLYIEQISDVGAVNNKPVYTIDKVSILPLFNKFNDSTQPDELKHLELLATYEFQDLYFSYSYDLSCTLVQNINRQTSEEFVWNHYFKQELAEIVGAHWIPNIIHGFFCHAKNSTTKLTNIVLKFDITIISRRNRYQDGVRYLKRGINEHGYVANHVETEQIVALPQGISSFLMVRGSVPVYWKQEPSIVNFMPKIEVMESNSQYKPAQKHFYQLIKRYGANIHCINLLREQQSKPREGLLTNEFQKLVDQISNTQNKHKKSLHYYEYDVKKQYRTNEFQKEVKELSYYLMLQTGCNIIYKNSSMIYQNGVARVNCVDCLDRTNLFMSILGEVALVFQLKAITRLAINITDISLKQEFVQLYSNIHQHLGNAVSLQYGGSEAQKHKSNINKSQLLISLKRHITNNTSDYVKQQQIDICHGYYSRTKPYLWESFLERTERTESMNNLLGIREWIQEGESHYVSGSNKRQLSKNGNSLLKRLRENFMETAIPKTHLSLKGTTIEWGDTLEYQSSHPTTPSKVLKQDNSSYQTPSPTKSTGSRQIKFNFSFSK